MNEKLNELLNEIAKQRRNDDGTSASMKHLERTVQELAWAVWDEKVNRFGKENPAWKSPEKL